MRLHDFFAICERDRNFTDKTKNLTSEREVLVRPQELESWTL